MQKRIEVFAPLVKYFLRRRSSASDRQPSILRGDHIMNVAVVACYEQGGNFNQVQRYVQDLRKRGLKRVDLFVYYPKRKLPEELSTENHDLWLTKKSFNFLGKVQDESLLAALSVQYDVLFDLSRGAALRTDVLCSKLQATWKVGEKDEARSYLLDFMVDVKKERDVRTLIHHLDSYTFNFNKPNAA